MTQTHKEEDNNIIMEKNEKIQQKQQRTIQMFAGAIFVVGCIFLLWYLLEMEDTHTSVLSSSSSSQDQRPLRKNPLLAPLSERQEQERESLPSKGVEAKSNNKFPTGQDEAKLLQRVQALDKEVRDIKKSLPAGSFMEVDEKAVAATKRLQDATRLLLAARYGEKEPYRVKVGLKFQPSNPTMAELGETDSFVIELAPSRLQPHSIYTFLEVARHWPVKKGAFHRRANHVLQVMVKGSQVPHLAFQEYSREYPHKKGTVGYAGRPSGPAWYVSIMDNTNNHGPGSQQDANPHEADSCFGRVVEGFEDVVVKRITRMPGSGFLDAPKHVLIDYMTILVPSPTSTDIDESYVEWYPSSTSSAS